MTVKNISEGGKSQLASLNKNDRKTLKEEKNSGSNGVFSSKGDILELSDEAKKSVNIQKRIETGFYDKNEVIEKVAKKLSTLV